MNKKNKLAIIYDMPYPFVIGGGQRRIYEISKRLIEKNWEIDWYCLKTWEGNDSNVIVDGINFIGIQKNVKLYSKNGKRNIKEALLYGFSTLKIKIDTYSLIWFGEWPLFHILFLYFKNFKTKKPFVIDWWETWGDFWYEYSGIVKGIFGKGLEKFIIKKIGYKIVLSKKNIKELSRLGGNSTRIFYVPVGTDFKYISSVANYDELKYKSDLIYVGRLNKYKNVDHLILAVNLLREKNIHIKTVIIGNGPEEDKLRNLILEYGLKDNILLFNYIDSNEEVIRYLKGSKIFVNPSLKEGGQSITNIEANACGLPIVVYKSDLGIDPEFISENINGFSIKNPSVENLANKIESILNLDYENIKAIKIGSMNFSMAYDWNNIVDSYCEIFQKILN